MALQPVPNERNETLFACNVLHFSTTRLYSKFIQSPIVTISELEGMVPNQFDNIDALFGSILNKILSLP